MQKKYVWRNCLFQKLQQGPTFRRGVDSISEAGGRVLDNLQAGGKGGSHLEERH